jgi:hypothetical protein
MQIDGSNGLTSTVHALIGSARLVGAEPSQPGLAEAVQMRVLVTHWTCGSSLCRYPSSNRLKAMRLSTQAVVVPFGAMRGRRNQ